VSDAGGLVTRDAQVTSDFGVTCAGTDLTFSDAIRHTLLTLPRAPT
jgi:hypothetical protein